MGPPLRSFAADAPNRDVLHKIGVTGGNAETRIANAKLDPTFLMAEVEIVATYNLSNINRKKLENLIHRIFDPARLDIELEPYPSFAGKGPAFQLDFGIQSQSVSTKCGSRWQTLRLEIRHVNFVECTPIEHVCKHYVAFENVIEI